MLSSDGPLVGNIEYVVESGRRETLAPDLGGQRAGKVQGDFAQARGRRRRAGRGRDRPPSSASRATVSKAAANLGRSGSASESPAAYA